MPVYPFRCAMCGAEFDVYGPSSEKHEHSECKCGATADRVWTAPFAFIDNIQPHYNYGLGCKINSRKDIKEAQRAYRDRTGSNLIEVGNEKPRGNKIQRQEYEKAGRLVT